MKVGIDARPIQGTFTGDCTYWRGLVHALARLDSADEYIIYLEGNLPVPELPLSDHLKVVAVRSPSWRVWSGWSFPRALRRDGVRVAHVQYTIPPRMPCPVVTSIHDVSFKRHPEFFRLKDRFILDLGVRRAAARAARILAISEHTKRELIELYGISGSRVSVVYPGVDEHFEPMNRDGARALVRERHSIDSPFVLTLGVIQPRKNLSRLLEAIARLGGIGRSQPKLVIVGKCGWMAEGLEARIRELGLEGDVVLTGYLPYEHLPALYNAADVFVYPSVYEGFGLPPLEAMACGTPVIVGNRSSLPEVVGEAGIMVDPYDPDAFADAIERTLASESLRAEMSARGLVQAKKFSWDEMARRVAAIYQEAAGS